MPWVCFFAQQIYIAHESLLVAIAAGCVNSRPCNAIEKDTSDKKNDCSARRNNLLRHVQSVAKTARKNKRCTFFI